MKKIAMATLDSSLHGRTEALAILDCGIDHSHLMKGSLKLI